MWWLCRGCIGGSCIGNCEQVSIGVDWVCVFFDQFYVVVVYWVVVGGDYYVVGCVQVVGLEIDFFCVIQVDVDYFVFCIVQVCGQCILQCGVGQVYVMVQYYWVWCKLCCQCYIDVVGQIFVQFFWYVVVDVIGFEGGQGY